MPCPCDDGAPDACAEHYQAWCGCVALPGRYDWPGCGCERCEASLCLHDTSWPWCPRCLGDGGWSWYELWSWADELEKVVVRRRTRPGHAAGVWFGLLGTYGEAVEGVSDEEYDLVAALASTWDGTLPELVAAARAILALRP